MTFARGSLAHIVIEPLTEIPPYGGRLHSRPILNRKMLVFVINQQASRLVFEVIVVVVNICAMLCISQIIARANM